MESIIQSDVFPSKPPPLKEWVGREIFGSLGDFEHEIAQWWNRLDEERKEKILTQWRVETKALEGMNFGFLPPQIRIRIERSAIRYLDEQHQVKLEWEAKNGPAVPRGVDHLAALVNRFKEWMSTFAEK